MAKKKTVVSICSGPYRSTNIFEGLRLALGLKSGWEEHSVEIIFHGDGVFFLLKGAEKGYSVKFWEALSAMESNFWVEIESLNARNITMNDVFEKVKPITQKEIVDVFQNADHHINF